ncbi:MAG TPA: hypothetical protein VGQ64_10565 [Candidatus Limnocylindrales bacterium]|nr:hypothetical protein [Candidatus Limnocylindrales bacterium]
MPASRPKLLALSAGAALIVIVAVAAAVLGRPGSPAPTVAVATETAPALAALDPAGVARLDPGSRDLAGILDPGEWVSGSFLTQDPAVVADLARTMGLAPMIGDVVVGPGEQGDVNVLGPHEAIVQLAAHPSVTSLFLAEDLRVLRAVSPPRPVGEAMPSPGEPYLGLPLPIRPDAFAVPPEWRAAMLTSLAGTVQTIDGRPYETVSFDGTCEDSGPMTCYGDLTGVVGGSGGRSDGWSFHAAEADGWAVVLEPGQPRLNGVPRWLGREAERLARSDPASAAALADYAWVWGFTWNPASLGLVQVSYARPCESGSTSRTASLAIGPIAATGQCRDMLVITVDVPAGQVVGRQLFREFD